MKVLVRSIEMICLFEKNGALQPIKFKINDEEGSEQVIKIHKIMKKDKIKLAGNQLYIFTCIVLVNGFEKICEIRYEISSLKWFLYKI